MKHKLSKRALVVLVLCVACVLAFGATIAQADVVDSGKGGENQLTVNVSNEKQLAVSKAGIKYNLYRIASANPDAQSYTFNYVFDVEAFKELGNNFNQETITDSQWQEMAAAAKGIVERDKLNADVKDVPVGDTVNGLQNGLYLVLIPSVRGEKYTFTFQPALVSLPSKVDANGVPVSTTDAGTSWSGIVNAVFLNAKWSMDKLTGSIKISKSVTTYNGPATFTFRITGKTDDGDYEAYAAVMFDSEGEHSTTVNGVPAGYEYTVTEVDDGASYKTNGENEKRVKVEAGQEAEVQTETVSFTNLPSDSGKQGYGIENHFVFDKNNDGDWYLEVRTIDASKQNPNE